MVILKGKFESEINEIEKLLQKLDLLEERNFYPNNDSDLSLYRNKNILDNWKSLIADNKYIFMLSDSSLLNFKFDENYKKISFTFFECPYNCPTYKEYLIENNLEEGFEDKIMYDYYESYILQCSQKEHPTIIRYDFDIDSYFEGLHPVSHMHIGFNNQIRLGVKKILYPKSFISFILRQNYPTHWKSIIVSRKNKWKTYFLKEKSTLRDVENVNWQVLDYTEFYLS